jgi:hypothetical protein
MTAPDPLAVRQYRLAIENARDGAERALGHIRAGMDRIDVRKTATARGDAHGLAGDVAELVDQLGVLYALEEVSYLVEDLDAPHEAAVQAVEED